MPTDCLFCKIISGEISSHKIYENDQTFAFLDVGPVSPGHFLVVPKRHAEDLNQTPDEDACAMIRTVKILAPRVMRALGASGYNLGLNHGKDAGQVIFHTHMHVIPRYPGEKRSFVKKEASEEELAEVADKIRSEIGS